MLLLLRVLWRLPVLPRTNYSSDSRLPRAGLRSRGRPRELEVLRLTAGARVGHQSIVEPSFSRDCSCGGAVDDFLSSKGPKAGLTILVSVKFSPSAGCLRDVDLHRTPSQKDSQRTLAAMPDTQFQRTISPPSSTTHSIFRDGRTTNYSPHRKESGSPCPSNSESRTAEMQG